MAKNKNQKEVVEQKEAKAAEEQVVEENEALKLLNNRKKFKSLS